MNSYDPEKITSRHLNSDELVKYHNHALTKEESETIRLHLQSCELCTDALRGISEMKNSLHIYDITHDIRNRIRKKHSQRKKIFSGSDLLSIILVIFILGLIILLAFYFLYLKG